MATKSFLNHDDFEVARLKLQPPAHRPDGEEEKSSEFQSREFSEWLGERLLARLMEHSDWEAAEPIALGSWARNELSPKSDIDLLFVGEEAAVARVVTHFSKLGLKIRYRVPENMEDWTVGVLPFDVLALFQARPLIRVAQEKWTLQIESIKKRGTIFRRSLIQTMMRERRDRGTRYDSIANFLEPNLKYGPGGLRDLEQSLVAFDLFRSKFRVLDQSDVDHALKVLHYYKNFFLLVRQKLHLADGGGDVLAAPEQGPLSEWLGFVSNKDFMREIQKGLSRVSFYADWMIEIATRSRARVEEISKIPLNRPIQFFKAFEKDASILTQFRVRLKSDGVFGRAAKSSGGSKNAAGSNSISVAESAAFGKKLNQFLMPGRDEAKLVALFRSRLIDHIVPEFRKIVGHVQHDQYHRFSVDAHILQALRELRRLQKSPSLAGQLAKHFKSLSDEEWLILAYACLYHDIAKGREGHHAEEGRKIALHDLKRFGQSRELTAEITWVVEQHLILSNAAFRENSRSPATWQKLLDHGVKGRRLSLLVAFTIIDIRATNPDAWNPWKERLMNELVEQLQRPETTSFLTLKKQIEKSKLEQVRACSETWPEALDPFLIHAVPLKFLVDDLARLIQGLEPGAEGERERKSLVPRAVPAEGGQTWIRFHSFEDRPGLFLSYVSALASFGLSIRHASVTTDARFGVYDWFEVKTIQKPALIEKWLAKAMLSINQADQTDQVAAASLDQGALGSTDSAKVSSAMSRARAKFDSIDFVSTSDEEWVISFRGRDQPGALKSAVESLFQQGLQIRWAKVHTWGRQIDDVFGVSAPLRDGVSAPLRDGVSAPLRDGVSAPLRDGVSASLRDGVGSPDDSEKVFTREERQEVLLKIRATMV